VIAADLPPNVPVACAVQAATHYGVPPAALVAMLKTEGGEVGKEYSRSHGTYYGPAQISNKWLPEFKKWNITAEQLRDDGCVNVTMGAYILAYYHAREADWPRAIARYNVGSLRTETQTSAGLRYAKKVIATWWQLHNKWSSAGKHEPYTRK